MLTPDYIEAWVAIPAIVILWITWAVLKVRDHTG